MFLTNQLHSDEVLASLREMNSDRVTDWRWRRAIVLEERRSGIRTIEDKTITTARRFLRDMWDGKSSDELAEKYPLLYEVVRIYDEAKTTRWSLEAMIMTGLPVDEIASRFGWGEFGNKLVELYEKLKFDVRSRLKYDMWIISNVLGISDATGLVSAEEKIWKSLAWIGYRKNIGTALLDGYMNIDIMSEEAKNWYDQLIEHQLTRRTARGMLRFDPLQSPVLVEVLGAWSNLQRLKMEQKANGVLAGRDDMEKEEKSLINSLQLTISNLSVVPSSGIEPRSTELLEETLKSQRALIDGKVGKNE